MDSYLKYIAKRRRESKAFDRMCTVRDELFDMRMNIIRQRINLGLTQSALGKLCDLSQTTIYRFECNLGKPTIRTLFRIVVGLGLKIEIKVIK